MFVWLNNKWEEFEQFVTDVIYDRRTGTLPIRLFSGFLKILSYIFRGIVQLRYFLYEQSLFGSRPLGCLVVVVGNLTVGGTGKTPIVEKFAKSLQEKGRKVAILSRGYKSKEGPFWHRLWQKITADTPCPPKVVSDGVSILLDSENAGDEPYMLAKNLPGVIVLVDKDRVKAGLYAIQKFGADTLILDDGFQYLPLKGRLNLLLVDKTNPFGNGYLLPRGILREPIRHLKRASYVFLTKSDGIPDPELNNLIHRYNPGVDIVECRHKACYLEAFASDIRIDIKSLRGKRVGVFSGIAVPESFERFFTNLGIELVYTKRFIDHHRFTYDELVAIFVEAKEAGIEVLVTTEKDAVRVPAFFQANIPFYYLRMEIEILSGNEGFDKAVSRLCLPKKAMKSTRSGLLAEKQI